MSAAAYRVYVAQYPFVARDNTELSMSPGDQLFVEKLEDGSWPNERAWMKGTMDTVIEYVYINR